jgi:hypothetical protein
VTDAEFQAIKPGDTIYHLDASRFRDTPMVETLVVAKRSEGRLHLQGEYSSQVNRADVLDQDPTAHRKEPWTAPWFVTLRGALARLVAVRQERLLVLNEQVKKAQAYLAKAQQEMAKVEAGRGRGST